MTILRTLRESHKLTLKEVCQKTGIDYGLLSKYEREERELSISAAKKLAALYNVSLDYLLGFSNVNNKPKTAIYPGSFDPVSNGHLDIIDRTAKIFDTVYILVSINPKKKYLFTIEERVSMLKEATKDLKNVVVEASNSLVLDYAKEKNAHVIIRGLRNFIDYQNEITLFQFNRSIDNDIDTFILFPSANNLFLSSSSIKELVMFGADINNYVPHNLASFIENTIKERI